MGLEYSKSFWDNWLGKMGLERVRLVGRIRRLRDLAGVFFNWVGR